MSTTPNAPTAREREYHYVLCDVTDCPGYHCNHVAKELAELRAALLAARREVEAAQQRLSEIAVLCRQTEEVYADDGECASFYATTLDKIAALAATQEER